MFAYLYITSQNVSLNNTVEVNFSVEGEKNSMFIYKFMPLN